MKHPLDTAKEIADLIRRDPIAASFVTQFIDASELLDCLDLRRAMAADIADAIESAVQDAECQIESLEDRVRDLNIEVSDLNLRLAQR